MLKQGGTYLITGGCGGLGFLFAEHLARSYGANLILIGRSALIPEKQTRIQALEKSGGSVIYLQVDVSDESGMKKGLKTAKEHVGSIHGVLHTAGIEGGRSLFEKDMQSFQTVLDPKIKGTLVLDKILAKEALDFICYFSSSSAILGDFGSCDYAVANRFQMAYADYRNELKAAGKRFGKSVVINWPLWKDGGMGFQAGEQTHFYLESSGQRFLEAGEGLALFEQLLLQEKTQHLVLVGQKSRVERLLGFGQVSSPLVPSGVVRTLNQGRPPKMRGLSVEECVVWDLKELISQLLKITHDKLNLKSNLADFGFDSIRLAEFAGLLTKHYKMEIKPILFFGHSTLKKLVHYFLAEHKGFMQRFYKEKEEPITVSPPSFTPPPFVKRRCWIGVHQKHGVNESTGISSIDENFDNKAAEFYNFGATYSRQEFQEEYLTFCPFPEKIPGFSMSRVFLHPEKFAEEAKLIKAKQIEMRQVLFCKEDFSQVRKVLDFGCGHGTDVIQIAKLYPHIETHGFTITRAQADLGNQRIEQMKLSSRATIFHKDSSKDTFHDKYELIIGVEVSCHVRDKDGLFQNISSSLNEKGHILLMDFTANLRGSIADPNVEIYIPTLDEWAGLLSRHHLVIDEIIDVSPQIANFQYDPEYEKNTKDLPGVVQDTWKNYANNSIALEKGWVSYCLFKLKKDKQFSSSERCDYNAKKLSDQTPYPEALEIMLNKGHISYPESMDKGEEKRAVEVRDLGKNDLALKMKNHDSVLQEITHVKTNLVAIFAEVLEFQREEVEEIEMIQALGITSLNALELLEEINKEFKLNLPTSVIFEYNTLDAFAQYIESRLPERVPVSTEPESSPTPVEHKKLRVETESKASASLSPLYRDSKRKNDIAIIGISCRCAGANGLDEFWELVSQGKNAIGEIKNEEWLNFFEQHSSNRVPSYYGAIEDLECFDPAFFNISPKETNHMDPAQRILLEESYSALEDAGYPQSRLQEQPIGTFIGTMGGAPQTSDFSHFSMLGNDTSILSARIAYYLNLKGPALAINTACSSSLVAIDLACQGLKNQDIDLAIAGGITLYTHPGTFLAMNNAGMLSSAGTCRPFDNAADGIVVGDGVGVAILKRLEEAERDHDQIYGVIRGSGTNQDGQTSGITVPSFMSQCQLEESVYKKSQINVEDIQYIEAHGTATKLGDPIEIHALTDSFQKFTKKKKFCAIGSLKANIGHTTAAAGVLSLIKVLLSLKHKQMAPSINFDKPNEHIDFENSPVFVNRSLTDWPTHANDSRLAAISAFSFSGTNAHMVIEEYLDESKVQGRRSKIPVDRLALIVLSAKNEDRLRTYAQNLIDYVHPSTLDLRPLTPRLQDVAYTLQVGREAMEERLGLIVGSVEELEEKLKGFLEGKDNVKYLYRGQVKRNKETLTVFAHDEDMATTIDAWIKKRKYSKLLDLWVKGLVFDWDRLYGDSKPSRISLPTYPFGRDLYRVFGINRKATVPEISNNVEGFKVEKRSLKPSKVCLTHSAISSETFPIPSVSLKKRSLKSLERVEQPTAIQSEISAPASLCVELYGCGQGVFSIQVNDFANQNLLSEGVISGLTQCFEAVRNQPEVRVILLTGGDQFFLTGGAEERESLFEKKVTHVCLECEVPVIAVMKGHSKGMGWLMGSVCDLMVCSEEGLYQYHHKGAVWLPSQEERSLFIERFGENFGEELLSSGTAFTGKQLKEKGIGLLVLPENEVDSYAMEMACELAGYPRTSLVQLKRHLSQGISHQTRELSNPLTPLAQKAQKAKV
ncbi:MAG: SDR family NAD(P)-dependent oxidoreductase [Kiritimatiellae bacterium]|nr:SDR family NAD(P)-dependent oxidoreductase [Kiritimatiellia bacterium]